ncbi:hypothetical protein SUGI_1168640 [Cryptomeria japonica]|uniref:aspartic proteinase nepenthesin-2 n=1 Tax=Cryptomeria japonica TaxID=3369 RepID=UPI002414752C|nr:aspartic proteinase nepenthesin-2 [Cryptomeria japonica]GLJ54414.1 hypothetical protein SUGI_1168640 [Cryptomeria japonica]
MARLTGVVIVLCAFLLQCSDGTRSLKQDETRYRIDMFRRDWPSSPLLDGLNNITRTEQVRRAIERSKWRAQRLQAHQIDGLGTGYYTSPVSGGDGEFIMQIGVGEPSPLVQHAIMDTGSDMIWIQCTPCTLCSPQQDAFYNPTLSSTYRPLHCPTSDCDIDSGLMCGVDDGICKYRYGYGDGSATTGDVAFETFSVRSGSGNNSSWKAFPGLRFGCGHQQEGSFDGVDGVVGLGRGKFSLASQLSGFIKNKFSYCLPPMDHTSGTTHLVLGDAPPSHHHHKRKYSSTPFVGTHPDFYYLSLEGISVEGKAIKYPPGTFANDDVGGFIIDSGTTLSYLPEPAYGALVDALSSRINATPVDASSSGGTGLCYEQILPMADIPSIAFHFAWDATFDVPAQNSFVLVQDNQGRQLLCLAFMNGGPARSLAILGNIQQQNYDIVYDLEKNSLSFAPAHCGKTH